MNRLNPLEDAQARSDEWVTLAQFFQIPMAHILKGRLNAEGIQAHIADEHTLSVNPLYTPALGGVRLQVRARDLASAQNILAELAECNENEFEDAMEDSRNSPTHSHCPRCQSLQIRQESSPFRSSQGWIHNLFVLLQFLFWGWFLPRKSSGQANEWSCESCYHRWESPAQGSGTESSPQEGPRGSRENL